MNKSVKPDNQQLPCGCPKPDRFAMCINQEHMGHPSTSSYTDGASPCIVHQCENCHQVFDPEKVASSAREEEKKRIMQEIQEAPLLTIGQMIEFLGDDYILTLHNCAEGSVLAEDGCDTLWEDVKKRLNNY